MDEQPFAAASDIAARWRSLTVEETSIATALIVDASDMVRVRWPDVDLRVANGTLRSETLTRIVAGMVRRAMLNRDNEGVMEHREVVGPFQNLATYSNPNNNLYLSAEDVRALDPAGYFPRFKQGWLA